MWLIVAVALVASATLSNSSLWGPLLGGSVSRGKRVVSRAVDHDAPVDLSSFDSDGELPLFKAARRLLENASPVVALRFIELNETEGRKRGNGTLLAWGYDVSSPFEIRMHSQTISTLGHPFQRLVVTGVAGDCRMVSRFVKQTALNHTVEFNSFASGAKLASELAEYMQTVAMGERPLVCHALICSGIDGKLHSVDSSCQVIESSSANAGRETAQGRRLLDAEYRANVTLDEAMALARRIVNPPSLMALKGSKGDGDGDGDGSGRCRELGFEFCVIYDDE